MERDCSGCKTPLTTETACRSVLAKGGYCRACRGAYKKRQNEARDQELRRRLHAARVLVPCLPIPSVPPRPRPIAYASLHVRLRKARGAATSLNCIDCGARADEWSYRGGCPDELAEARERDGREMRYSLDLSLYDPRCKSCHVRRDMPGWRPCRVATCGHGTTRRLDYCFIHWIGPRRLPGPIAGTTLGRTNGPRDEHGRVRTTRTRNRRPDSPMTHKECNRCGTTKDVRGFSTRGRDMTNRRDPYKSTCLECDRIKSAERYKHRIAAGMQANTHTPRQ